jgi:hypothetical protein
MWTTGQRELMTYKRAYFECVENDIQFDSVLAADEMIYFARVSERVQYQNGDDE